MRGTVLHTVLIAAISIALTVALVKLNSAEMGNGPLGDLMLARTLQEERHAPDIALGTKLDSLLEAQQVSLVPNTAKRIAVVFVGSCGGCSTLDFSEKGMNWKSVDFVFIVDADSSGLGKNSSRYVELGDSSRKITDAFRPRFLPRAFLFDQSKSLIRAQQDLESIHAMEVLRA